MYENNLEFGKNTRCIKVRVLPHRVKNYKF